MSEYVVQARNLGDLDDFTRGYLECAEWCGIVPSEDDSEPMLELTVNLKWSEASLTRAISECQDFREAAGADLEGIDESQAGHDFWLTRNRHGAGFWDRGLGEVGERLSKLAHTWGEAHVWFDEKAETLTLE